MRPATWLSCAVYFPLTVFAVEDVTGQFALNSGVRQICVVRKDDRQAVYTPPPSALLTPLEKQVSDKKEADAKKEQDEKARIAREEQERKQRIASAQAASSSAASGVPVGVINLKDVPRK